MLKNCYLCERNLPAIEFNKKRKECKNCSVAIKLLDRYGITLEQYNEMLASQGNRCAICPATPEEVGTLCVDHDHSCCPESKTCGECIRGLLCDRCNRGLGYFLDSVQSLSEAVKYIEFHRKEVVVS